MTSPMTSKASYFEAWISNSGCSCARAMNFFCFLCFLGQESHSNYCQLTFTCDLETEGHVVVYLIFAISACICPTAMNVLLFPEFFRSRTSFQLLPITWTLRAILKLKVTSWSTWLLLSLLVFVLPRWFFCFVRFSGHEIHFRILPFAWPSRLTLKLKIT